MYTFHEAVSALQLLEEEVLDTHKLVMDDSAKFLKAAHSLFNITDEVDYDQEGEPLINLTIKLIILDENCIIMYFFNSERF